MEERNYYVVPEIKGPLKSLEEAETECSRQAATSGSNCRHYVVKVISCFQREAPKAQKVECKFSGTKP